MSLDGLQKGVWGLILVSLILASLAIALDAFQGDMTTETACVASDATYNSATRACTGSATSNETTTAFNATDEGLLGTSNASSYLSTIGTLIGVAALIAVVVGAFYFMRR